MGEFFGAITILLIIIAAVIAVIYFILKGASYFKRTFGVSLWPGVISLCLSLDIIMFGSMASQEGGNGSTVAVIVIASLILLAYTLYRDIRYYKLYSIPAFLLQGLIAIAQLFILIMAIVFLIVRNTAMYKRGQLNQVSRLIRLFADI